MAETDPEKLPFLRSCHRTPGLIYLELELLGLCSPSPADPPARSARYERRYYYRPRTEQSDGPRRSPNLLEEIPRLGNANGGDIYLFPTFLVFLVFLVYYDRLNHFALLEYSAIQFRCRRRGNRSHAWAKSNKDGSRDIRFKSNFQIPVVLLCRNRIEIIQRLE